jgi:uncharacterized membrane protein
VTRNIDELMQRRAREAAEAGLTERIAAAITRFVGSMRSVYVHAAVYGFWIAANLGAVPGLRPWDPTLVVLAMIASVEAIFLTSFVLINQNRQARLDQERSELTLQMSLLAEQQARKLIEMSTAVAEHLGAAVPEPAEAAELTRPVRPVEALEEIERRRPEEP